MVAGSLGASADTYGGYRARLVETLREKGIRDLAVLKAFAETPRHLFVPEAVRHRAYEDAALPIGAGQTISQPFTQACYLEQLRLGGTERVLEVGTGSGYQTALLARLAAQVFSMERVRGLAESAIAALRAAANQQRLRAGGRWNAGMEWIRSLPSHSGRGRGTGNSAAPPGTTRSRRPFADTDRGSGESGADAGGANWRSGTPDAGG